MARTVGEAFDVFIKNSVNLDPDIVARARKTLDELLEEIHAFGKGGDFFVLYSDFDVHFGSFSRKTKCRPLDDLDLMIGISAEGAKYSESSQWNDVTIFPAPSSTYQQNCKKEDGTLSSNMVLGKFKEKIIEVNDLRSVEVKKNQQAIVVDYKTSEWSFDIVPCFHTTKESDGRDYYLIPNGSGKWMKTNPVLDRDRLNRLEQKHNHKMRAAIRLVKYWNQNAKVTTVSGYVLECLLLQFFEQQPTSSESPDILFWDLVKYIHQEISKPIMDPKQIQGDLNDLTAEEKESISRKAYDTYQKANEAITAENAKEIGKSLRIWREIFGKDFPEYER